MIGDSDDDDNDDDDDGSWGSARGVRGETLLFLCAEEVKPWLNTQWQTEK